MFVLSAAAVVVYLRKTHSSWRYALGAAALWLMVAVCGSVAAWFALGTAFPRLPESAFMILGFINLPALLSSSACLLAGYGLHRLFQRIDPLPGGTHGSDARVVIASSRVKLVLITVGAFLFVALGIVLFSIADSQRQYPPLYVKGAGIASIGFFGLCALYALFKLFDGSPGLVLDAEGIIDNSSGLAAGRVAWREIRDVRVVTIHKQRFLAFVVDDPGKYLARGNLLQRWAVRVNYRSYGTPILISSHALKIKFDELERLVQGFRR